MSDNKTQADLDALAAVIKPVEHVIKGVPAGPQAFTTPQANKVAAQSQATAAPVDPFEAEARQFRLEQLKKQADFEDAKRELELEDLKLSIRARKAQIKDFERNEFKQDMAEQNASMDAKTKGIAIEQKRKAEETQQKACTHKKGGMGLKAYISGKGNAEQYAVMKHIMANQDMWVRCLRCGKSWKPPLERSYPNTPQGQAAFIAAQAQYEIAKEFSTLNGTSSSTFFTFSDHGQDFREKLEHVTLR